MQTDQLGAATLASVLGCLDPLLLAVDTSGTILDRRICSDQRVPADLLHATTLRAVLSREVCQEWLRLVRAVTIGQRMACAIVVLDGVGQEMVCAPLGAKVPCAGPEVALLALLPLTARGDLLQPQAGRMTLKAHEWGPLESLSRCQMDTLRNVCMGLGNEQIARKICRTKRAVEWHIRFLNQQLGTCDREALALIGRDAGLHRFSDACWQQLLQTRPARRRCIDLASDLQCQAVTEMRRAIVA